MNSEAIEIIPQGKHSIMFRYFGIQGSINYSAISFIGII